MRKAEHRSVEAICNKVADLAAKTKGTAHTEVVQKSVSQMRALLRQGRYRQAEDVAYGIVMECTERSEDGSKEADESQDTSKTLIAIGGRCRGYRTKHQIRTGGRWHPAERDGRAAGHLAELLVTAREQQVRAQFIIAQENIRRVWRSDELLVPRGRCGVRVA